MRSVVVFLLLLVLLFFVKVAMAAEKGGISGPIPATLVKVIDGDTLRVKARIWVRQDVETSVRILGIDAPEAGRHARCLAEERGAVAATSALRNLVRGGALKLYDVQPDKYGGRVLARVKNARGQDVAQKLLDLGVVHPYGGDARKTWCKNAS